MTAGEHYRAAEQLLAGITDKEVNSEVAAVVAAMAQAHATLALAAASSVNEYVDGYGS